MESVQGCEEWTTECLRMRSVVKKMANAFLLLLGRSRASKLRSMFLSPLFINVSSSVSLPLPRMTHPIPRAFVPASRQEVNRARSQHSPSARVFPSRGQLLNGNRYHFQRWTRFEGAVLTNHHVHFRLIKWQPVALETYRNPFQMPHCVSMIRIEAAQPLAKFLWHERAAMTF